MGVDAGGGVGAGFWGGGFLGVGAAVEEEVVAAHFGLLVFFLALLEEFVKRWSVGMVEGWSVVGGREMGIGAGGIYAFTRYVLCQVLRRNKCQVNYVLPR